MENLHMVGEQNRGKRKPSSVRTRAGLRLLSQPNARVVAFVLCAAALVVWASPPVALVGGALFALCFGNPMPKSGHRVAKYLLQACVVLLGFGMNLRTVLRAGLDGALFAAVTIGTTLVLGYWVGRVLKVNRNTSTLISAGTAICGGSAIAAMGSVLVVTESEIAVSMGTVFLLNAVALYAFPFAGHLLHLDPQQFGVWAGVAIHDISSVVGASVVYGRGALETATAVKLSRSLWIVPLTLGIAFMAGQRRRCAQGCESAGAGLGEASLKRGALKAQLPWFIGLFVLASVARSYIPSLAAWAPQVSSVAKGGLTIVLCLIGASLSVSALRSVGWKAALQGVLVWGFITVLSLVVVVYGHFGG